MSETKTVDATAIIPAVPPKIQAIKKVLESQMARITEVCGQHLSPERLYRVAMATIYKTPKLQECDPWSIAGALIEAAQIGVEVGGPQDEAYLIPRKNKNSNSVQACFQIGYKGLIKVAIDTGAALSIHGAVVHENDEFDYALGVEPFIIHKPKLIDRGKPIAAWCGGKLPSGERFVDVMSVADVEKRRACSQDPNSMMWKDWWDEGALKTVIRHACKRLKGGGRLAAAVAAEHNGYNVDLPQELEPTPRPMPKRLSETKVCGRTDSSAPPSGGERQPGDEPPSGDMPLATPEQVLESPMLSNIRRSDRQTAQDPTREAGASSESSVGSQALGHSEMLNPEGRRESGATGAPTAPLDDAFRDAAIVFRDAARSNWTEPAINMEINRCRALGKSGAAALLARAEGVKK